MKKCIELVMSKNLSSEHSIMWSFQCIKGLFNELSNDKFRNPKINLFLELS